MLNEVPVRSLRDRVLVLTSFPAFASLSYEAAAAMAEPARNRFFRAGEVVFEEGSPNRSVHLVYQGQISSTRQGKTHFTAKRADGIGYLTGMTEDPTGIRAVADVPTRTLEIPVDLIWDAYRENFPLFRHSVRIGATGILEARGHLPIGPDNAEEPKLGTYREESQTLVQRLLVLREGAFGSTNTDALIELARHTAEVRFEEGTRLWEAGDPADYWLSIDYGRVRCETKDGSSVRVGSGFGFGIMSSVAGQPHQYSAIAETDLIAARMHRETLFAVLESHFELGKIMATRFAQTLLKIQEQKSEIEAEASPSPPQEQAVGATAPQPP